jgi:hypothetical protein
VRPTLAGSFRRLPLSYLQRPRIASLAPLPSVGPGFCSAIDNVAAITTNTGKMLPDGCSMQTALDGWIDRASKLLLIEEERLPIDLGVVAIILLSGTLWAGIVAFVCAI